MPQAAVLAVVAIAAAVSTYSAVQQNRAQKAAAREQKNAADISTAQQQNQEMQARREQVRRQRITAAQIQQGASNQGASASSGEFGSLSALSTNVGANLANMAAQSKAAAGIGAANQAAVNAQSQGATWGSYGQIAGSVGSLAGAAGATFNSAPSSTNQPAPITRNDTYV